MAKRTGLTLLCVALFLVAAHCSERRRGPDDCKPVVVAHRGASGYVPEHTTGAYALAVTMGADYVEPDAVMTKDGHIIARHENELSLSTDVAEREEFANRYRTQNINGVPTSGWFSEDFTLAEIKTLRSIERIPNIRPGNARMDGAYDVPTLQEIIDLVRGLEISENRTIGIYPEIKHSTHFQRIGLGMEQPLVDIFHNNGYIGPDAPVYIQSMEVNNLKELKKITNLRLVQLFGANRNSLPFDQAELGTDLTYGKMATPEGLAEIATYASAVGPDKGYIIPRDENDNLASATSFVADAHRVGLQVHPYTFRSENTYLPREFRSSDADHEIGDMQSELRAFIEAGIDGAFVDQPDLLNRLRNNCWIIIPPV
ncbi:glycerophosphodiester phosphodiesterase, periplasmic-like [Aricia agestis]|uniref:glycerophosphodiester phosphodiesterase, periplasmic-like n=1 Tax=Aricia agestis TaxID=91739 RepID=UPI001C2035B6|nr:glycerophosphodiester phosphodiesterase, periplasmic-like [Aricia agestis]